VSELERVPARPALPQRDRGRQYWRLTDQTDPRTLDDDALAAELAHPSSELRLQELLWADVRRRQLREADQ
jgi:hypothetical protein